eukprot:CAMPEP_0203662502 /NCGR_PEP_ID=MMETSP0090-20130426/451_1 /ASSEMBLY_ACC=CAM_ASM_001088 /TAXON_ID=426623 /ORGANISM="Chaetoceros affinis, Strain CCMP159" /LENGTH=488 /DNA_ID=CAMNT_0050525301 /DNA_START=1 /DNA_END=1467 /DNA_ORIENTATION=-
MAKSAAQIRRMQKRAQQRGESYEAPEKPTNGTGSDNNGSDTSAANAAIIISKEDQSKINTYQTYEKALSEIETDTTLNSKQRRSAKRKAEAIACEECKSSSFSSIQELTDWYKSNGVELLERQKKYNEKKNSNDNNNNTNSKKNKKRKKDEEGTTGNPNTNPYILFIGQIPYTTTEEDIYQHFQKYIGKKEITKESMKIRIPQDHEKNKKRLQKQQQQQEQKKTEQQAQDEVEEMEEEEMGVEELYDYDFVDESSNDKKRNKDDRPLCRGFAFAEFNDPELMYECLKLHQTDLNGRRINVIRSAGGGKEARKEKHAQRKKEQDEYISSTVDKIIHDYIERGELQEGELDSGAVLLCKRRSAAIVEAALLEYIEQRKDKDLENPSSFFTRVICNVTEDGEAGTQSFEKKKLNQDKGAGKQKKKRKVDCDEDATATYSKDGTILGGSSVLAKAGVDMSISQKTEDGESNLSSIFPSMGRGRGRGGRGAYM